MTQTESLPLQRKNNKMKRLRRPRPFGIILLKGGLPPQIIWEGEMIRNFLQPTIISFLFFLFCILLFKGVKMCPRTGGLGQGHYK